MPDLLPFGQEIRYVSFHEGKKYSKQNIVTAIVEATGLTEEEAEGNIYQRIKQLKTEKGLLQITGDEHKFSFVGISLVRNTETIESIPNIVIAVYPKWRKIDSSSEQSSSFFNQFFFSSLHSYSKFREKKKEYFHREEIGADFRVWGSGRAHVFDCMLALVADVNRFGIIPRICTCRAFTQRKNELAKNVQKGQGNDFGKHSVLSQSDSNEKKQIIQRNKPDSPRGLFPLHDGVIFVFHLALRQDFMAKKDDIESYTSQD